MKGDFVCGECYGTSFEFYYDRGDNLGEDTLRCICKTCGAITVI